MIKIRPATQADWPNIWPMFEAVIREGDAFVFESIDDDEAFRIWFAPQVNSFVAEADGQIVGAYYLRPNHPGRGCHVANASYVVDAKSRGQGTGKQLGQHSICAASELGYSAIQFNCVVSTNFAAVRLWKSLGFQVIGTVPQAFRRDKQGPVDVLIMHRFCGNANEIPTGPVGRRVGLLERLLHHDRWTTSQLLSLCGELNDSQLDREFDIGHRTIRATLHHIIHNMEIWSLLMGGEDIVRQQDQTVKGLCARLQIAADRLAWIARDIDARHMWDEEWIDHLEDPPLKKSFGASIAHVMTHSMHHRAHVLFMMRKIGLVDLPEGDVFSAETALSDSGEEL